MNEATSKADKEIMVYYRLGSLHLDMKARRLFTAKNQPIDMGDISYRLLEVLTLASPDTVSVTDLKRRVWGDIHVSDDTVRQRIKLLRKSLEEAGETPTLVGVVHGRGYSIAAERITGGTSKIHSRRFMIGAVAIVAVMVLILLITFGRFNGVPNDPAKPYAGAVVAIEFFEPIGHGENEGLISRGLSLELVHKLVELPGLRVMGSPVEEISESNAPDILLQGTVAADGSNILVTVTLLDVSKNEYIWTSRYNTAEENGLFNIVTSIAGHAALMLHTTVEPSLFEAMRNGSTDNVEAYRAYVIGMGHLVEGDDYDYETSARYQFEKALSLDPDFALPKRELENLNAMEANPL